MNTRYVFKTKESKCDLIYNPEPAVYKFYQICMFKNPETKKYHIRRCIINEKCDLVSVDERTFNEKQFKNFFKSHRDNEFKTYSTYDISLINLPNPGDILQAQSPLLNNDYSYTGFASYK